MSGKLAAKAFNPWRFAGYTLAGVAGISGVIFAWHQVDQYLISSPRFVLAASGQDAVPAVVLDGVRYSSREKIEKLFQTDLGRSVYLFPIAERRRQLLALDWVRDAHVSRIWPDRVVVRIVERQPVAFVRSGSSTSSLIDEDGVLLPLHQSARFRLPVVTGITARQSEQERRQRIHRMLTLKSEVGAHIDHISEIGLQDPDNLKVTYPVGGRAMVLYLGHSSYALRLKHFLENLDEIRRRLPNARALDLRLEDRITAVQDSEGARRVE